MVLPTYGRFQEEKILCLPDSVALSSPCEATRLLELTPQQQTILLPFEGTGVDTTWELHMPKASNLFDYNSIADVLVTIEYTALGGLAIANNCLRNWIAAPVLTGPLASATSSADNRANGRPLPDSARAFPAQH